MVSGCWDDEHDGTNGRCYDQDYLTLGTLLDAGEGLERYEASWELAESAEAWVDGRFDVSIVRIPYAYAQRSTRSGAPERD